MADTSNTFDASLSVPISPAPEPLETSQILENVEETNAQVTDQELGLETRSWDSNTSHKSEDEDDDGWMVTPLATLAARRHRRVSSEDLTKKDEANVERSVRAALRLLEESDEVQESDVEEEGGLVDFMHEVMEDRWTLEDRDGQPGGQWRTSDSEEEEEVDRVSDSEEEEVEEDKQEDKDDEEVDRVNEEEDAEEKQEQGQEDEWQEAYTAKGRVYYYNRRTRESSWKKPSHYNSSKEEDHTAAAATEEQTELHESVVRQSLGYHPSASASPAPTIERQTTLFCSFCGEQQPPESLAAHFQDCATAKLHKRRMSPLYLSFERALGLISEDVTLRSLHYATSFPDPTPHCRPDATSMQDSLLLLRPSSRRSSYKEPTGSSPDSTPQKQRSGPGVFDAAVEDSTKSPNRLTSRDSAHRDVDTEKIRRKKKNVAKRKSSLPPTSAFTAGPVVQNMETCPYCSRSFAEGRLAKHEAVCQRVFGNEGSWGRGSPSTQVSSPSLRNARVGTPSSSAASVASKLLKLKDHTLQQSYKEHQATLVLCPCCRRKFAPSGAQQHIAICKGVQNRPKNPIPRLRDYAIAG